MDDECEAQAADSDPLLSEVTANPARHCGLLSSDGGGGGGESLGAVTITAE